MDTRLPPRWEHTINKIKKSNLSSWKTPSIREVVPADVHTRELDPVDGNTQPRSSSRGWKRTRGSSRGWKQVKSSSRGWKQARSSPRGWTHTHTTLGKQTTRSRFVTNRKRDDSVRVLQTWSTVPSLFVVDSKARNGVCLRDGEKGKQANSITRQERGENLWRIRHSRGGCEQDDTSIWTWIVLTFKQPSSLKYKIKEHYTSSKKI